jgi:glycosyltransferase involved in cell wall biosynthesis
MKYPRILITTYHDAFLIHGGGEHELFTLVDHLRRFGLAVDIYGPFSRNIQNYDVVLHFSVHPGGLHLLERLKSYNKPIVLWPNFWPTEHNSSISNIIDKHIHLSDEIVFKSNAEKNVFTALFEVPEPKINVVQIVADPVYAVPAPANLFKELYGIDSYAIWVGIVEPIKNQLAAIRALKELNIPLVLVGKSRDDAYYQLCKEVGEKGVYFINSLPLKSEIMRSALQNALFYIELSEEPPGLSAIEAGLAGCKLVLSNSDWTREIFSGAATLCDPVDQAEIITAVKIALNSNKNMNLSKKLMRHCDDEIALKIIQILIKVAD